MSQTPTVYTSTIDTPALKNRGGSRALKLALLPLGFLLAILFKELWIRFPALVSQICAGLLLATVFVIWFLWHRVHNAPTVTQTLTFDDTAITLSRAALEQNIAFSDIKSVTEHQNAQQEISVLAIQGTSWRESMMISGFAEMVEIRAQLRSNMPSTSRYEYAVGQTQTKRNPMLILLGSIGLVLLARSVFFLSWINIVSVLCGIIIFYAYSNPSPLPSDNKSTWRTRLINPAFLFLAFVIISTNFESPAFTDNPCNLNQRFFQGSGCLIHFENDIRLFGFLSTDNAKSLIIGEGQAARITSKWDWPWEGWRLSRFGSRINYLQASSTDPLFAVATSNDEWQIVDSLTREQTSPFDDDPHALFFTANPNQLFLVDHLEATLVDVVSGDMLSKIEGENFTRSLHSVNSFATSADGKFGAYISDTYVKVFEINSLKEIGAYSIPKSATSYRELRVDSSANVLALCSDAHIQIWVDDEWRIIDRESEFQSYTSCELAMSADGRHLAYKMPNQAVVQLWSIDTHTPCRTFQLNHTVQRILFAADKPLLAVGDLLNIHIFDVDQTRCDI